MARPRTSLDRLERRGSPVAKRRRRELSGTPLVLSVVFAEAMGQSWTLDEAVDATGIDADTLDGFMAGGELTLQQLDVIASALRLRLCWANGSPVK